MEMCSTTSTSTTTSMSAVCDKIEQKKEREVRIVKMTEHEFKDAPAIHKFFKDDLPKRKDAGRFRMLSTSDKAKPKIGKNGLREGEKLIFTFKNEILWIGEADSGRCPNIKDEKGVDLKKYPFYFDVKMDSLIELIEPKQLIAFENELRVIYPNLKNLVKSHGWPIIEENEKTKKLWDSLIKNSISIKSKEL